MSVLAAGTGSSRKVTTFRREQQSDYQSYSSVLGRPLAERHDASIALSGTLLGCNITHITMPKPYRPADQAAPEPDRDL